MWNIIFKRRKETDADLWLVSRMAYERAAFLCYSGHALSHLYFHLAQTWALGLKQSRAIQLGWTHFIGNIIIIPISCSWTPAHLLVARRTQLDKFRQVSCLPLNIKCWLCQLTLESFSISVFSVQISSFVLISTFSTRPTRNFIEIWTSILYLNIMRCYEWILLSF